MLKDGTMRHLLEDPTLFCAAAHVGGEWIDATPHGTYTCLLYTSDAADE